MDSNSVPPQSRDGLQVPGEPSSARPTSSTSDHHERSTSPGASTVLSRTGTLGSPGSPFRHPQTPGAVNEQTDTYFEPLQEITQYRSRANSTRSISSFWRSPSSTGNPDTAASRSSDRPPPGSRQPSIQIRRRSNSSIRSSAQPPAPSDDPYTARFGPVQRAEAPSGRPRSLSQPDRQQGSAQPSHSTRVPQIALPRLTEEGVRPSLDELGITAPLDTTRSLPSETRSVPDENTTAGVSWTRRMLYPVRAGRNLWPRGKGKQTEMADDETSTRDQAASVRDADEVYDAQLVDYLDTIDPEVQTLSTLTNVQNSLFVPDLGPWLNRRPTYNLTQHPSQELDRQPTVTAGTMDQIDEQREKEDEEASLPPYGLGDGSEALQRSNTISSRLTDSHYAALPHGQTLEGWSREEKEELDDHVRHMLHSRRSKFKRTMKGFGQYVRTPLGFFVTLYATLITLFGLAWVLFLIGWIYVGDKQSYTVHIIDSVLVALFAIMGDGLAPFRAIDTYHLFFLVKYTRKIQKWEQGKLPPAKLEKKNVPEEVKESFEQAAADKAQRRDEFAASQTTFPDVGADTTALAPVTSSTSAPAATDLPNGAADAGEPIRRDMAPDPIIKDLEEARKAKHSQALTYKQAKSLEHHRNKLAKSHSFYKPDETFTHYAFPLKYLIAVVVLLDCHSCLQISLGACTWGINYHHRPFAITTVILCVSITCNITAGLVITIGDRKTRKKEIHNLMSRQELTSEAIGLVEANREKKNDHHHNDKTKGHKLEEETEQEEEELGPKGEKVNQPVPDHVHKTDSPQGATKLE